MVAVIVIFSLTLLQVITGNPTNSQTDFYPEICHLDKQFGDCEAHVLRYYYDRKSRNCTAFTYSGCSGNANNFETFEKCHRFCNPKSEIVDPINHDGDYLNNKKKRVMGNPECPELCHVNETCRLVRPCYGCTAAPECVPNTISCDHVNCGKAEQCVLQHVQCIIGPCYPVTACIKIPGAVI